MQKFTYLRSINADYIDELFDLYTKDPQSVDPSWCYFFEGIEMGGTFASPSSERASPPRVEKPVDSRIDFSGEAKVAELITAYRELGGLLAQMDPLSPPPTHHPLLDLAHFGLSSTDLSQSFTAARLIGMKTSPLSEIIQRLKDTYCGQIGVEYTHIQQPQERDWLQKKMEASRNQEQLDAGTQKFILKRLTESETFERFLHTRYVAQKRFSIEGGEGLIPILDCIIETGGELGAEEFVLGMAHRGRLNVLTNIFGKKPEYIFTEFEGAYKADTSLGEGDVKYHMGYSADITTRKGKNIHLSLASNPSHLEFINAVIEGATRAKQNHRQDSQRAKVVPISIHGDAAFSGQGVCYETLNLSQLQGYGTGGTLHIVINNQVGFTTSPRDSRSTTYCTDLAKMLEVPIFHVNGDHPEALWFVSKLCMEYRQKFKKDVFIDLVCYRKYGHNEGDEPTFTQPLLYKTIKSHRSTRELYSDQLVASQTLSAEEAQGYIDVFTQNLTGAQTRTKTEAPQPFVSVFQNKWKAMRRPEETDHFKPVHTAVTENRIRALAEKINHTPSTFHIHPKLTRFYEARLKAIQEDQGIDWGNGEALAFATLLEEGHTIRLSGQDAERGTFSHRHSVLYDFENGETYTPLSQIKPGQGTYNVHNSHLSETAVLGFEYGFSLADPSALVIWEAQFGDFANGAQVIIDQFISSSESKWQRMSGLTLLLPHGFEGQGPEHSSARLERFLQLCGKRNMIVGNLTTPAQLFHALRRQVKREFRKPLVIMSPKSLLRNPLAISHLKDFTDTGFAEVLDDTWGSKDAANIKKVILCSGKIYYDLLAERNRQKSSSVAIVRMEQLYPWPDAQLAKVLERYPQASLVWTQEEPRNMGAWTYVFNYWQGGYDLFAKKVGSRSIQYIGRDICAAPAVGSHKLHEKEQEEIIKKALL